MSMCKACLNDEVTPFGASFTNGICSACLKEGESHLDFKTLVAEIRESNCNSNYNCVILVTGAPEDFYVVERVIASKLHPLLFYVNSFMSNSIAWENIHKLISLFDLDLRAFNTNIFTYKRFVKYALRKYGDILLPIKLLKYASTIKLCNRLNITHVITGEQQESIFSGVFSKHEAVEKTKWSHVRYDLNDLLYDEVIDTGSDVHPSKLAEYFVTSYEASNIRWSYLYNYTPWDQWVQDFEMSKKYKLNVSDVFNSFDYFYRPGCSVYFHAHDFFRKYKFGYTKVRDLLSREIRKGRISRDNAFALYCEYLENFYSDNRNFFEWLGVRDSGLDWIYSLYSDQKVSASISKVDPARYFKVFFRPDAFVDVNKFFLHYHKGL